MSFWANKLAQAAPEAAPQSSPVPNSNAWWAPQPVVQAQHPPVLQQYQQAVSAPQQPVQAPAKAASARPGATGTCPDCGGEEYYAPPGTNTMPKCYLCGYNPRFSQMSAGGGIQGEGAGPATPAKQVSTANNFNPGQIIGKIG